MIKMLHCVQCISGPLQARTQSLEATVYTRTIVFHHWLVHITRLTSTIDAPCGLEAMGLQIAKDMQYTVLGCSIVQQPFSAHSQKEK